MSEFLKVIEFTILDKEVTHIKNSKLSAEQLLMFYIKQTFPEVEIRGSVVLRFPENSEITWWYDHKVMGTHYVQRIFKEKLI